MQQEGAATSPKGMLGLPKMFRNALRFIQSQCPLRRGVGFNKTQHNVTGCLQTKLLQQVAELLQAQQAIVADRLFEGTFDAVSVVLIWPI